MANVLHFFCIKPHQIVRGFKRHIKGMDQQSFNIDAESFGFVDTFCNNAETFKIAQKNRVMKLY